MRTLAVAFLCACSAAPLEVSSPRANAVVSESSTWGITGRDAASYTWSADTAATLNGNPTMRLEPRPRSRDTIDVARDVATRAKLWAAAGWHLDAASFVGKRVRFSADVRTENASDGAWVWFRVDGHSLCNMQTGADTRLKGTNPFTKLSCVLDVALDAKHFAFGLGLSGSGRAWIGPGSFEVVAEDVPVSAHSTLDGETSLESSTWVITGRDASSYVWSVDPTGTLDGKPTMRLEPRAAAANDMWAATAGWKIATPFLGKRIRFSAAVRTENVSAGANVWMRVDGASTRTLCNMQNPINTQLKGTNPFTKLSCVLDVTSDAKRIVFGSGLTGSGRTWVGPGTLEVVSEEIPVSPHVTL